MDKTILFCTENRCPEPIFSAAMNHLRKHAKCQIISISHKPIDLGINVCIGERKRSWFTLYRQMLHGCRLATTKWIGIAEHDCFYSQEHLDFIPPTDDKFYYNENVWLVSWDPERHPNIMGMYSRFWDKDRLALSQMVCERKLYKEALEKRIALIREDRRSTKNIDHINEPGASKLSRKLIERANSGSSAYLRKLLPDFIELERYETFNNKAPNLDVRHGKNFTGPRRGVKRRYAVRPWGRFDKLLQSLNTNNF